MGNSEDIIQLKKNINKMNEIGQNAINDYTNELIINKSLQEENDKLKANIKELEFGYNLANGVANNLEKSNKEISDKWMILNDENIKLKTEIEQLNEKWDKIVRDSWVKNQEKSFELSDLNYEIEQLKAELEQSVKLPCKVGSTVYLLSSPENVTNFEEEYNDGDVLVFECNFSSISVYSNDAIQIRLCWNNKFVGWYLTPEHFGKVIFTTREEAEQALKGGD